MRMLPLLNRAGLILCAILTAEIISSRRQHIVAHLVLEGPTLCVWLCSCANARQHCYRERRPFREEKRRQVRHFRTPFRHAVSSTSPTPLPLRPVALP